MVEIAILDDEKFLVDSLELEITALGHRVKPFYEARPFLDYIQVAEPDLVFLDLQLPDIHGMEVLQRIRQTLQICPDHHHDRPWRYGVCHSSVKRRGLRLSQQTL